MMSLISYAISIFFFIWFLKGVFGFLRAIYMIKNNLRRGEEEDSTSYTYSSREGGTARNVRKEKDISSRVKIIEEKRGDA